MANGEASAGALPHASSAPDLTTMDAGGSSCAAADSEGADDSRSATPPPSVPFSRRPDGIMHSLWGSSDLLACYHEQPGLLLPLPAAAVQQ